MPRNFSIKELLGQTSVEPGRAMLGTKFSHKESRFHGRFNYDQGNTELKICQGGSDYPDHTWERSGHSGGPLCELLLGGVRPPLTGGVAGV
jgi:hypothetical protein